MEIGALFDWDGVVIDSSRQHEKRWEMLAEAAARLAFENRAFAGVTSAGEHGPQFVSADYPLDESVLANRRNGAHFVRFIAGDQSIAGGIYGVRLLRGLPAPDNLSGDRPEIEQGSKQEE